MYVLTHCAACPVLTIQLINNTIYSFPSCNNYGAVVLRIILLLLVMTSTKGLNFFTVEMLFKFLLNEFSNLLNRNTWFLTYIH